MDLSGGRIQGGLRWCGGRGDCPPRRPQGRTSVIPPVCAFAPSPSWNSVEICGSTGLIVEGLVQ